MKRKRKNLWNLVGVILLFLVLLPLRGEAAEPEGSSEGSEYECSWCGNTEAFITVKNRQETAGHRKVIVCEICSRIVFDSWYIPHRWKDGICEECEFVCVHPWGDRDKDHQCDICKKELSEHTGGTATCTAEAICEYCGKAYGDKDSTNHTGPMVWTTQNETQHEQKCDSCGTITVSLENHEWENGTCTECGYVCQHAGGEATCKAKAICEYCGESYGEISDHKFLFLGYGLKIEDKEQGHHERFGCQWCNKEEAGPLILHSGGTCKKEAICVCYRSFKDPRNHEGKKVWTAKNETQHEQKWDCCGAVEEAAADHDWENGVCKVCGYICQHIGGTATCMETAKCEICGLPYGDKDSTNHTGPMIWTTKNETQHEQKCDSCGTVTVSLENHEWENGTCTECGYVCAHDDTDKDHQCDICRVELSQHTGGNATCTAEAICEYCGKAYGDKDPDNHTGKEEWIQTATTHEEKWSCCGAVIVAEEVHEWENGICKECGYTCSHTFGEWQTITAATCTEKGSKKHTCSICQLEETQEIPAAGHDWNGDFTIDKAATCEAPGSKSIHCKNCTEVKDVTELPATGHHFGTEPSEYTAPTENKSGQAVYVCSDCQEKRTVTIPALELQVSETAGNLKVLTPGAEGWSWESDQALLPGTVVIAVARYVVSADLVLTQSIQIKVPCSVDQAEYTLGNDGTAVLHCSGVLDAFRGVTVDGTLLTEGKDYTAASGSTILTFTNAYLNTLKAGTHTVILSYDSGEVTTTLEIREAEPVVCDHTYGKASYTWSSNYSTCTASHTCTKCGEEETASVSVSEKITKEATCTESGEKTYTAVFENTGFEKQTKTETLKAIGHDWDEGKVTEEATTEKTGVKTYTCKNCQETRTEELPKVTKPVPTTEKEETPKTEAAPKADTVPKTTSVTAVPKTGDESMPALWLLLTLLSGGSLLLLGRRKRQ